jgi:hypothetical protein
LYFPASHALHSPLVTFIAPERLDPKLVVIEPEALIESESLKDPTLVVIEPEPLIDPKPLIDPELVGGGVVDVSMAPALPEKPAMHSQSAIPCPDAEFAGHAEPPDILPEPLSYAPVILPEALSSAPEHDAGTTNKAASTRSTARNSVPLFISMSLKWCT